MRAVSTKRIKKLFYLLFKMPACGEAQDDPNVVSCVYHASVICHVQMTDIEGFLTIYGHSDNSLNNKVLLYTKLRSLRLFRHLG